MKKAIILFAALATCVSLSACGNSDNQNARVNEDTVSENTKAVEKTPEVQEPEFTEVFIGDKITVEFAEITIDESGIAENIRTSITTGNATRTSGPQPVEGAKFAYMRGTIKSLAKSEISSAEMFGTVVIDGYTYKLSSVNIIEANGNSTSRLAPLTTYTYIAYAQIPDELADNNQSCVVNIAFDEEFAWNSKSDLSDYPYTYTHTIK